MIRIATNGIFEVLMEDDPDQRGLFTVRTGAAHPQPGKNVFFGATDPTPAVNTSFVTFRDDVRKIMWVNVDASRQPSDPGLPGYTVQLMNTQPSTFTANGATGFTVVYTLPGYVLTQEVTILGTALANSAVRHTLRVTHPSPDLDRFGVRFLWDWKVASIDAPFFRTRDADTPYTRTFTGFSPPFAFERYEETDDPLNINQFTIFGTVQGGSQLEKPSDPDRVVFAHWDDAKNSAWSFTITGNSTDGAIVYFWGETPIDATLNGSYPFTQYVTTNIEALRRSVPVLHKRVVPVTTVCAADLLTYTLTWSNAGDATSYALTFTDTLAPALAWEPGSLAFWAQADGFGAPSLAASAWAPDAAGPWTAGEPPAGQPDPVVLRWVVDRAAPGKSGQLTFRAKVRKDPPWFAPIRNLASATNYLDETVFWSETVTSFGAGLAMRIDADDPDCDVYAGDEVSFTISVFNNYCNNPVQNLHLWDTLPPGAEYIPGTATLGGVFTPSATRLDWTLPSLGAGATVALSFRVRATGATPTLQPFPFCALLDYEDADGVRQQEVWACPCTVQVRQPAIQFRKFINPPGIAQRFPRGGAVTYVLDFLNEFNFTATNLMVWDSLPPDTTFDGASDGGAETSPGLVTWTIPSLGPKSNLQRYLTVRISATECETCCPNVAYLQYTDLLGNSSSVFRTNNGDPVMVAIEEPGISVSKTVESTLLALDDPLAYRIEVGNWGTGSVVGVVVRDDTPPGFGPLLAEGGLSRTITGTHVEWSLPDLEPGMSFTLTLSGANTGGGIPVGSNYAYADGRNVLGCTLLSATSFGVIFYFRQPALSLELTPSAFVVPSGSALTFALSFTNTGDDTAFDLVIWDTPAAGLGAPFVCVPPAGGSCWFDGTRQVFTLPRLDPGAGATASFTATVTSPGWPVEPNQACGGLANRIGQSRPGTCSGTFSVDVANAFLNLAVTPFPVPAGEYGPLVYHFTLSNTGGLAAQNVLVTAQLPPSPGVFLSCTVTAGTCAEGPPGFVTWSSPGLGSQTEIRMDVRITATPVLGCSLFAWADYENAVGTPQPTANAAPVCVAVVQPVIVPSVTAGKGVYAAGEPVTYTVALTNTGTGTTSKLTFSVTLPPGVTWVPGSCGGAFGCSLSTGGSGEQVLTWSPSELAPGQSLNVSFSVLPPVAGSCSPFTVANDLAVSYANPGGIDTLRQVTAVSVTVIESVVTLTLTPSGWVLPQGAALTYTIAYANTCSDTARNVTLWDTVPAGTVLAAAPGALPSDGTRVVWNLGNVPPGRTGAVSFTVTIQTSGPSVGPNTARASSVSGAGATRTTDSNAVTVTVRSPILAVTKTADRESGITQDEIAFTITARNSGDDVAFGIMVVDTLPEPLLPAGWSPAATRAGTRTLVWSVPDLPPGAIWTASVTGRGADVERAYANLVNVATAFYRTGAGVARPPASGSARFSLTPRLSFAVYPSPYQAGGGRTLKFKGLPEGTIVHLYTLSGREVRRLDGVRDFRLEWDGLNAEGAAVAPGIYLYAVEFPSSGGARSWKKGKVGVTR